MTCERMLAIMDLELYGEAGDAERHELQNHLRACPDCARRLEEERRLKHLLDQRQLPGAHAEALARFRAQLGEVLDELPSNSWAARVSEWLGQWLNPLPHLRPLTAVVPALVVLAFLGGWMARGRGASEVTPAVDQANVISSGQVPVQIESVNRDPATGDVKISFEAVQHRIVTGPPADPHVQRMLIYAVQNRPNPGIELDSMDALKASVSDAQVRQALLWALQHDGNPGVRLKAVDSLRGNVAADSDVRDALVRAVLEDSNAGVRAEAIEALAQAPRPDAARLLEQVARSTENLSVRMRCAAAMRQIQLDVPPDLLTAPDAKVTDQ